jgi:putative spermidine/putrescine transport system ATP-binding protein/putrescine transport system ATP-binding protein
MTAAVEFQDVTKRFGSVTAVAQVSFTVAAGETIALLGPSGCGKTTILRLIAGFDQPDEGTIVIGERDMRGLRPYQRNVGLLFQHYALFPHMTVAQNVGYGLRYRGYSAEDIPARVAEMLGLVRLAGFDERRPHQLSGGQQQRVALARALATHPSLLLLDEPLSALDAKLRHDLRTELKQVLAAVGSTAIVVTHDQEEAMSLGERVFVMNGGRLMQIGTPNDVYWRPNSRFVAEFMGRANWISGEIERSAAGTSIFRALSGWTLALSSQDPPPGAAHLCVRPETIAVLPKGMPDAAPGAITGHIDEVVPLGPIRQLAVALQGGERLIATQPNRADHSHLPGQEVAVIVPPAACMVFPAQSSSDGTIKTEETITS